ncbi:hypothetical protein [Brevibacillus laterosporus]|nr:hypothetical protein [Brevibacillus laterosporus]
MAIDAIYVFFSNEVIDDSDNKVNHHGSVISFPTAIASSENKRFT